MPTRRGVFKMLKWAWIRDMSRTWLLGFSGESLRKYVGQQHHRKALGRGGNVPKKDTTPKHNDRLRHGQIERRYLVSVPQTSTCYRDSTRSDRRSEAGQRSPRRAGTQPTRTLTQGYISAEGKPPRDSGQGRLEFVNDNGEFLDFLHAGAYSAPVMTRDEHETSLSSSTLLEAASREARIRDFTT